MYAECHNIPLIVDMVLEMLEVEEQAIMAQPMYSLSGLEEYLAAFTFWNHRTD